MSPEWLRAHQIVDETPENFVHTPVFSLFQSQNFQLMVEQQRLQFSLRIPNEMNLRRLQTATVQFLQILPHVPYTAVGLNFTWTALAEKSGEGFELTKRLFLTEAMKTNLAHLEGDVKVGSILYNIAQGYRLRLLVEPQLTAEGHLSLDFNYHFDIHGAQEGVTPVNRLLECFKNAEETARRLLGLDAV